MPRLKVEQKYNVQLIKIGLNVAYYRKLKGYTQEQLAEKSGLSRMTVAGIENSDRFYSMALGTLFKLADALEIPIKKFFDFRDEDD